MNQKNIALHCQQGSSDKVYMVQIVADPGGTGYVVNFQYGRRGSHLNTGTKTPNPVSLMQAETIFDKLVREKKAKGYLEVSGTAAPPRMPQNASVTAAVATATQEVQLLNAVEEEKLESLFTDSQIGAQEKYDGNRMLLKKSGGKVIAYNRRGIETNFPSEVEAAILELKDEDLLLDGEIVGTVYYAFDLLEAGGVCLKSEEYVKRAIALGRVLPAATEHLRRAPLEVTTGGKRALFEKLQADFKEGIVFKSLKAPYTGGRPASGGAQLKYKFCESATCRVEKINANRRSVSISVMNDKTGKLINVGNCTIPPNHEIPAEGAYVEIRYLYAYRNGSLYQPVYLGERNDKNTADNYDSLKFKNAATA